jgi:transposase, IS6 family
MAHLHHAPLFRWRHFPDDIIILALRWYLRYSLSYRDLEEILAERCVEVDHTTVWRWVNRYAPELDQRLRPYLRLTLPQWRADETYIRVVRVRARRSGRSAGA